jgi:hypothetical protein
MDDVFWGLNTIASKLIVLSDPPSSSYTYEELCMHHAQSRPGIAIWGFLGACESFHIL